MEMIMQNTDPMLLLGTEIGRLLCVFLFFHYVVKSTKKELGDIVEDIQAQMHVLTESVQKIFVRLAENESLREKIIDLKERTNKTEERVNKIEIHQRTRCPVNKKDD
jgi:hypothetical protein